MLCYAALCYPMLRYAMLCCSMLCYLCYAMLCYARLCCAILCYAALCYAMLCYAALCYAMLRNAMLCCPVLCYAILCRFCGGEEKRPGHHCWRMHVVPIKTWEFVHVCTLSAYTLVISRNISVHDYECLSVLLQPRNRIRDLE